MAPRKKKRKSSGSPRFTPHSLGQLIDYALSVASPGQLADYAATAARLDDRHSLLNRVAVAIQAPSATAVHGKGAWRALGYRIGTGNPGLAIFHRRTKATKASNSADQDTPNTTPTSGSDGPSQATSETSPKRYGGYGITYVWDAAQVVPLDCTCTEYRTCERPPVPAPTPAGPDRHGFADLVAHAAEGTDTDEEGDD
ncbi:hypothetical protein ACFVWN_00960 [Nocardiopsis flavescens]|uniref:hypothetical protein n=1 Tax=Nocardiopsis flavescens TaxID=758803 RepID=UPI0036469508